MPTKLRKMLGDINAPETVALMRLIETQSQHTLTVWAESWARRQYLPAYQAHQADDDTMQRLLDAAKAYTDGETPLAEVKALIKEARTLCGKLTDPIAVAAARAISTGCATCTTATGALGYLFYGAAVAAYQEAGLAADAAVYDELASKHLQAALEDLRTVAVPDEPKPAKINWNC